jgi:purine nucleoside phosphorylase
MAAPEPGLAAIAGSGMGSLVERLAGGVRFAERVPFEKLPDMGSCTVDGHRGEVALGVHTASGRPVAVVSGRRHVYEGGDATMEPLIRWLDAGGFRRLVTLSAAGSVHSGVDPGELVVIQEIIDLQNQPGVYPARGDSVRLQPSRGLTRELERAARRARRPFVRGTLACGTGPAYETPAEIRALQRMGADVATMSAAPETRFGLLFGMEVAVVAAVTNRGTGIGHEPPEHALVVHRAESMCRPLGDILLELAGAGDGEVAAE